MLVLSVTSSCGSERDGGSAALGSLTAEVNPLIGSAPGSAMNGVPSGRAGDTFPGACVPFGEVQWSPDTPHAENAAGYNYADTEILGFSLTHFSGAGCSNSGMFRILPTVGDDGSVAPRFDHADERARPGAYSVGLANGVRVELAATTRGGLGRFTFPPGSTPTIIVDGTTTYPYEMKSLDELHVVDDRSIAGSETHGNFCGTIRGYRTFVHAEFDTPFTVVPTGSPTKLRLVFAPPAGNTVHMRVALSPVSIENAAMNLEAEIRTWDWDAVGAAADARWEEMLGRIRVDGGTPTQRRIFYTALYHSLIHPSTFSDVNGEYPGFDQKIYRVADGHVHYHTFSGWDIYRSQVQLLALLAPDVAHDIQATLLDNAQTSGGGFDQWSMGNIETHVMIGDAGALMVANLDAFGIDAIDPGQALVVMRRSALDPKTTSDIYPLRIRLPEYLVQGYVTRDVSRTLEYAVADAAIAAYAQRHGDDEVAAITREHAANWETQFNPETGYLQPRNPDGTWGPWAGPGATSGYTEGNAAQYTWLVPQDYRGLVNRLGGREVARARLDSLFENLNAGLDEPHFYIGNEPEFGVPWAYLWAGAPARTQDVVRRVLDEEFADTAGGLPGNDDLGATSSWYVWASLGMYPTLPGEDVLTLNTPAFPSIAIDVPERKGISITAAGAPALRYVASARLDGRPHDAAWLRFADLSGGATVEFALSATPTDWGSAESLEPPSLSAPASINRAFER